MEHNDFFPGMKVTLSGEFGVIVSEKNDFNQFGIICWDSPRVNDFEDWTGLFGTFIQMGGKILDENHIFKFINNDGSTKYLK